MVSNKLSPEAAFLQCERLFRQALTQLQNHDHFSSLTVKRCWVAHSGGLDSQVLLHLAARCLSKEQLGVIHINHALQSDADHWQRFSQQQAERLDLEFYTQKLQLTQQSEEAARQGRYTVFEEKLGEAECLLMGHHADDQAETLLFRQLRGTGLQGITGIPVTRALGRGHLLRPLLSIPQSTLQKAAVYLGLEHIEDPSNATDVYDRNFLRNRVLPVLKQRWPYLIERFTDNARRFEQTQLLLNEYLHDDLSQVLSSPDQLSLSAYAALSKQRQKAVLRYWLQTRVNIALNERQIEEIENSVIAAGADALPEYVLPDCSIRRYQAHLYLVATTAAPLNDVLIQRDGRYDLADGLLDVVGLPTGTSLRVQRRQGGERCLPVGQSQHRQVKKLLQDRRVLPWHRANWPLLYRDDELAVVPGVCICIEQFAEISDFSVLWQPF